MSKQADAHADYAYAPRVVEVYFVEPSPSSKDGYRTLGHFPMATVPRVGETVTITGTLGGEASRFKIYEVIHHIPPTRLVSDQASEFVLSECTCVISQDIKPADIADVITHLCKTPNNRIGGLPRPHQG